MDSKNIWTFEAGEWRVQGGEADSVDTTVYHRKGWIWELARRDGIACEYRTRSNAVLSFRDYETMMEAMKGME